MKSRLTDAEMLVMGIIWDDPKHMVLSEIVAAVNGRWGKDWKPQTVSTYLEHLVRKGYLKRHRNGKVYTYEPLKSKDKYMAVILGALYNWYSPELKETDFVLNIAKPETRMNRLEINCRDEKALFLIEASRLYDEGLRVLPEWIPCSERLPFAEYGESDNVLCSVNNRLDNSVKWVEILYFNGGCWCLPTGEVYESNVEAWQPLPTPYKGEQE